MSSIRTASLALVKADALADLTPGDFEFTISVAGAADVVKTFTLAEIEVAIAGQQPGATRAPLVLVDSPAPGDYTVAWCRIATTGERISAPVTATINVPFPAIDVPASLSLALA